VIHPASAWGVTGEGDEYGCVIMGDPRMRYDWSRRSREACHDALVAKPGFIRVRQ
jgi:hypothetical protein